MKALAFTFGVLFSLSGLATPLIAADVDPWDLFRSGFDKQRAGDFNGAIAEFTKAIETDPKIPRFYEQRATTKESKGDVDGAIADWTAAIYATTRAQSVPILADDYEQRGCLKQSKGDFKGAIIDYSLALENSLRTHSETATPYYLRATAKHLTGDLHGAYDDYVGCAQCRLGTRSTSLRAYVHLDIWVVLMKLGDKAGAERQLTLYVDKEEKLDPEYQAIRHMYTNVSGEFHNDFDDVAYFLLNRNGLSLPAAECPIYEYSHYYYAAEKALLANDKVGAAECCQKYLSYIKPGLISCEYMVNQAPFSFHLSLVQQELKSLGIQ